MFFSRLIKKLAWNSYSRSLTIWLMRLLPLNASKVMLTSWSGASYSCNPRVIAESLANDGGWDIRYALLNVSCENMKPGIKAVEIGSLEYYLSLYTSRFIITNTHLSELYFPYKKRGQVYIFTGHGGSGIKKIEFDAPKLPADYLKSAATDTSRINLFLSNSSYRTRVIRSAYRYNGEVLVKGTPRNDMLVLQPPKENDADKRYLIYAPTFRNGKLVDIYRFNIDRLVEALGNRFGGEWYIRVSSHPNMRSYYKTIYSFDHPRMIDIGDDDLQNYIPSSDALITDYSSSEMDFYLLRRPVFQLCKDRTDYDRGFYINPEDLPFPFAETEDQLISNILSFDNDRYLRDLDRFNRDVIGLNETGHATEAVVQWMHNHTKDNS